MERKRRIGGDDVPGGVVRRLHVSELFHLDAKVQRRHSVWHVFHSRVFMVWHFDSVGIRRGVVCDEERNRGGSSPNE